MNKKLTIKLLILSLFLSSIYMYMSGGLTVYSKLRELGYTNQEIMPMMNPLNLDTVVDTKSSELSMDLAAQHTIASEYIGYDLQIDSNLSLKHQVLQAKYQNQSRAAYFETMLFLFGNIQDITGTLFSQMASIQNSQNDLMFADTGEFDEFDEQMRMKGITSVRGIIVVNKQNPLPPDYYPGEDPQAAASFMSLINDMRAAGFDVSQNYSGFRSFEKQQSLYQNYVSGYGEAQADTFSARPGFSEHQTGLAFDLLNTQGNLLGADGTQLDEVAWLQANAAYYGFIIRYPQDKEHITGYMYEPWHLRFVGPIAHEIVASRLTLEEFLGVEGGQFYN